MCVECTSACILVESSAVHDSTADYMNFTSVVKAHLKELICCTVVDGGWRHIRWMISAPLQLTETVDAVKVTGVQLGEVDVREVCVQAVRTHLLLPILKMETKRESSHQY